MTIMNKRTCLECIGKEECIANETVDTTFERKCHFDKYANLAQGNYEAFKRRALVRINKIMDDERLPFIEELSEYEGAFVNIEYTLPNGKKIKLLDDNDMYLAAQVENPELEICYGVVIDAGCIIIGSYDYEGSNAKLLLYRQRSL